MSTTSTIPAMWSWQEFIDRASAPETIPRGSGRHSDSGWAGASWDDALALATNGWTLSVPEVDVAVAALRGGLRDRVSALSLTPVWEVTGSEVDVAAYLSGVPECMIDCEPRQLSSQGRVVTFLIPATYSHTVPHDHVINRGVALTALCSTIITAAHSVEVWSGYACSLPPRRPGDRVGRYCAVARVISAGEPLDVARLMFAMAHPAMLRRLWFGVWDSAQRCIAEHMSLNRYGAPEYDYAVNDLPGEMTDAYVLLSLIEDQPQWRSSDTALAWCMTTFAGLGLIAGTAATP